MKRRLLTLVMALMAILTASAQKKMVVVIDGKPQTPIEVWRVDEIQFVDDDKEVKLNDDPQKVNLGLSVQWADRNMGATSPEDIGSYIGWGDITLSNLSKKLQYFPVDGANKDIFGGDYDVAKKYWGDEWRMPSQKEMQELIELCDWTWDSEKKGYVIKHEGFEGSLFLPVTGYREGYLEGGFEGELTDVAKGFYWTGSINADDYEQAHLLQFDDNKDNISIAGKERFVRMAIRPVCGPAIIPTSISDVVISNITDRSATVTVTLAGSLQDVTLAGLAYGTDPDALSVSDTNKKGSNSVIEIGNPLTFTFTDLAHNTTFYVMAYVKTNEGKYLKSEIKSFTTKAEDKFPVAEAIDLDLPSKTKWASWNMGASSPKDVPITEYARYGWSDGTGEIHTNRATDYPAAQMKEIVSENKIVSLSKTEYDIATNKWGKEWQLPTVKDFQELVDYCDWEWYTDSKVIGLKVISRKNPDHYICLPAAGRTNSQGQLGLVGEVPFFWTSQNHNSASAVMLRLSNGVLIEEYKPFCSQASIRPIMRDNSSDNPTPDNPTPDDPTPETPEVGEAVDLGLSSGTKWADRNIGAVKEADYGEYIAWGDTKARDSYNIVDYIHYDPSDINGFKYLGADENHTAPYTIGGTEYDAAHVRWGGDWRMPTRAQVNELRNECKWTWTTQNGIWGYKVSGSNGKSIFLPAAGYKIDTKESPFYDAEYGFYWTDEIDHRLEVHFNINGITLEFTDKTSSISYDGRYKGLPIRPVQPK